STKRELEELDAALETSRRMLDRGAVFLIVLYIGLLAGVWRWSSNRIVEPLRNLERNAASSLSKNESFTAIEGGGAEVVSLSRTVQALVGSLEERVGLRTTALERQTADLETEVATRSRTEQQLAFALKTAHAALDTRTEFLAQMSHELRTPLGAILGYAEMLGGNDLNQADRPKTYQALVRNGSYLLGLINDLLSLTEMESGEQRLQIVEICPGTLAKEVIEMVSIEAEPNRNDLRLRVTDEVAHTIFTDPRRLKQILVNLLGNALKFTTSGTVELCIGWSSESEHPLEISVRDSGPGIPPEDLDRVFDAFFQAAPTNSRGLHGVGLGLAISKNLAAALGAVLTVESSTGVGTTFHLRLPNKTPGTL
ncbi:MAG: ATP-binding protein, partial [bacterium]